MAHVERTRAVVEANETYDGDIIPSEQADLGRPVRIRDKASVLGCIYGETIETQSESSIKGSVMASEAIEMKGSHIHGEVGTPGKVVAEGTRVEGTVTGKRVRLTDCVVRGNVVGTEVILEDCVVLGIASADRRLTIENSLCYTFRGRGEIFLDRATLVLPQAIANGSLKFETPVAVAGLGRLDVTDHSHNSLGENIDDENAEDNGCLPQLTEADLYDQGDTTYLTLAPRVLNLEKVTDRINELEEGIMAAIKATSSDNGAEMDITDVLELLDVDTTTTSIIDQE